MATHHLTVGGDRVVKVFRSFDRGEHEREWAVLTLLHRHAADLVPAPLSADLAADPPSVTMSVVPGVPLGGAVPAAQQAALAVALRTLWSVPVDRGVPPRRYRPPVVVDLVRRDFAAWPRRGGAVGAAMAAAQAFVAGYRPAAPGPVVLGHSDPNLANYLWDGARVRIVDFEDAGRSDLAYELATLVEHVTARDTDWSGFLAGFAVEPAALLAGRRLAAALWLHTFVRLDLDEPAGWAAGRVLTLLG